MTSPQSIKGSCHCKSTTYTVSLPPSLPLPLAGSYDHSTDLRLCIGFHFVLHVSIPTERFTTEGSGLTSFTTPSRTLHFCPKCGASLFFRKEAEETVFLLAATIDLAASSTGASTEPQSLRELVVPRQHISLADTTHGIERIMADDLPRFKHGVDSEPWSPDTEHPSSGDDAKLNGSCYCGGVAFSIMRPDDTYESDVILREWVKPGRRYCASYCFCHSCRVVSGAPFWVWAFIPRKQLQFSSEETMQEYDSFADSTRSVTRRFCRRCGCHLFFTSTGAGGRMWDVAVGVLEENDGWFVWRFGGGEEREVDRYIANWVQGKWGYEEFGREYCREVVEEAVEGLERWVKGEV